MKRENSSGFFWFEGQKKTVRIRETSAETRNWKIFSFFRSEHSPLLKRTAKTAVFQASPSSSVIVLPCPDENGRNASSPESRIFFKKSIDKFEWI